jgi:hypothetical protein
MALTDVAIRNAKPGDKPYKLTDGAEMFLQVTPAGGKLWRLKYRVDGRETLLVMGAYPETSLSDARPLRNKSGKWHPDAIERVLAHGAADKVRAAYYRGAHWDGRVVHEVCLERIEKLKAEGKARPDKVL